MGFAQQCCVVGSVQICVVGDGVQGKGTLPLHQQYRSQASSDFASSSAQTGLPTLCEWLRMKFSAAFLRVGVVRGVPWLRV